MARRETGDELRDFVKGGTPLCAILQLCCAARAALSTPLFSIFVVVFHCFLPCRLVKGAQLRRRPSWSVGHSIDGFGSLLVSRDEAQLHAGIMKEQVAELSTLFLDRVLQLWTNGGQFCTACLRLPLVTAVDDARRLEATGKALHQNSVS